jgi:hypothetical protein
MITHTVFMKLMHSAGSEEEQSFLEAAALLSGIPKVNNYRIVRELSPKNNYDWGLVMEFNSPEDYQSYNDHPDHTAFVENVWIPNVLEFQEIDYQTY